MNIQLAYGKNGLRLDLDERWNVQVVEPRYIPGVENPTEAMLQALRHPLGSRPLAELAQPTDRVGIIFNDITRATPNRVILTAILDELAHVPRENITLFNALGTHRPNTEAELRGMLGDDLVDGYRIVQNNCFEPSTQVCVGQTASGNPIWLNRELVECDLKILTGFIEPHFFAGFSGGPKGVLPALAGQESVLTNHGREMIAHPKATWGVCEGNPIWEEMREVALMARPTFLLNVTLNAAKAITGVFAGEMLAAPRRGRDFVREKAMVPVAQPYDIVITTNSGYPLDQNLYQCVKGMSAAQQIVRAGGAIILAGACEDGLPDHGRYAELLAAGGSAQGVLDLIAQPGFSAQDQWQVQIQAQIQLHAEVYVYSDGLSDSQIERALFRPCRSIEATVSSLLDRYGPDARICVLPEGPQTIAYLQ